MSSRTLVIGDIHGGYKALIQVLERASVTHNDTLIFLGVYVDGWSESYQLINYLIELSKTNSCVFIRGNHDTWCEDWLKTNTAEDVWLKHGGLSTVDSYLEISKDEKEVHLNFFNQMINYLVDERNRLFIHAGYSSMHGPEKEAYTSNYSWDRTLWEMALTMDKRIQMDSKLYPKRLKLYNEIFIGHTPTLNYDIEEPMNAVNVWNIDTGAGFYGRLTILDADTKEFWQSDPLKTIYPLEKGRNRE